MKRFVVFVAGLIACDAHAQTALQVLSPIATYNFSAKPIAEWECLSEPSSIHLVLRDSNGIVLEDTGWIRHLAGQGTCNLGGGLYGQGPGIGHDIPEPWNNPLNPRWIKGLTLGKYTYEMSAKDDAGRVGPAVTKSFEVVPNVDAKFDAGQPGTWSAISGDWESITPATFGAMGTTSGKRVVAVYDAPVYVDGRSTLGSPANFDTTHVYSYTVSIKVNCPTSSCAGGPAFAFRQVQVINGQPTYRHVDFLVTGDGQLAIEGYWDLVKTERLATVDLRPFANVHQFFSLRIEFRSQLGSAAVFVNDKKVFAQNLGQFYSPDAGKFGLAYQGGNVSDSFEVQRVFVRPSIWESIGNFLKSPIE